MSKVYQIVTEKIIEKLEKGQVVWQKGWLANKYNYQYKNNYRGINLLLLDKPGGYLTFNQIKKMSKKDNNIKLKKGSKSEIIIAYTKKSYYKEVEKENGETEKEKVEYMKPYYHRVFHESDVEGLESSLKSKNNISPIESAENIIENFEDKPKIERKLSDKACYQPKLDKVITPKKEQFNDINEYYSTIFHELAHSTGNQKRLNRFSDSADQFIFASESYSKEELVAEISSAMLCNIAGIETEKTLNNSAGYIKSWIKKLKDDSKLIVKASNKAQKVVDYIVKKQKEQKTA